MNPFDLASRSVVYAMDPYCGWCWGFSERMGEFEAANRHRVAFTAIAGGLFTGEHAGPLSRHPYIAEANRQIAQRTGAQFGAAYQKLVAQGDAVMDSTDAAAGLAALRAQAPERAVHWAHQLQEAFYSRGLSLSAPGTIAGIASAEGLDAGLVLHQLADGSAKAQAQADFALTRALGVSAYPTLLYVDGSQVHRLPATGAALAALNSKLDALLA
jgi:putative protein-disulfide isomerase